MNEEPTKVVGRRVAVFLIDGLILWAISAVIFFALAGDPAEGLRKGDLTLNSTVYGNFTIGDKTYSVYGGKAVLYFLLVAAIGIAYWVIWSGRTGRTIGKSLLGIKVIKDDGSGAPPGYGKAAGRWILYFVDAFPFLIPYLLGFITAASSKHNKRIGDMAAGTLVVRADSVPAQGDAQPANVLEGLN